MQNQKSAIGLDANIAALIGYPIGIVALILIFIEKENKFVRFHALQSVLWWVGMWVAIIVVAIVGTILSVALAMVSSSLGSIVGLLVMLLYLVLFLGLLGGVAFAAFKAYSGEQFKLPVVGGFAEKWA